MNQAAERATSYEQHLQVLQSRAATALSRGGFTHLVVPSGTLHYQMFDDRDYPYAVNPQFKAWVPLTNAPGSWLVYTPGKRPQLIFLQPHDYWHAVPSEPCGEWARHFDIVVIRKPEEALRHLPVAVAHCAILGEPLSALGDYVPNNPMPVLNHLEYLRAFKTPYEVEMMRLATKVGVRAHRMAERAFRLGASEFGIHMAYCQAAAQDVNELPYSNIVALNQHAAILHYTDRDRLPAKPARSFLIDAGASHAGYACDITRTYAFDTTSEFQSLIDAVDTAQQAMCEQVRGGVDYRTLHVDAHLALADILRRFGIVKCSAEAAVQTGISATFFPHGIGHGIGLQVHEVGGFMASESGGVLAKPDGHPYLRLTRTLQPGMVVTIEPGLYFIDILLEKLARGEQRGNVDWERVTQFKPFGGIRIEDDVVCTENAPVNLTREEFAALPA